MPVSQAASQYVALRDAELFFDAFFVFIYTKSLTCYVHRHLHI